MPTSPEHSQDIRGQLPAFLDFVRGSRRVLVSTHLNPDGDALGSALAMSLILDQLGLPNEVLNHHDVPDYLRFLPGSERVRKQPEFDDHDAAVVLDLDALDRLGTIREFVEACPKAAVIDHHIPNDRPGQLRIIETGSPATAAILCDLFFDSEVEISPDIANCLLTGILTDTGSFRFPNTTPHCLHLAGRLLEMGASLSRISDAIYMSKAEESVRLLGEAIHRMKMESNGRLAWVVLTHDLLVDLGAKDEHSEGIVNELLSIQSVEIAAVLRESKPGRYKASLRSRPHLDVAKVANQFGGGGHRNAAGLTMEGEAQDVEGRLIGALRECLASS